MNKTKFLIKLAVICLFLKTNALASNSNFFERGKNFFNNKKFDKSKIFFERDIVFNPKNARSYLYLAKIFNEKEKDDEQEKNLKNVLLIDPQNDEAIYMLTLLKIKQSNYDDAKKLIDKFELVCKKFCSKKKEMKDKLNKLTPENVKD